ncbi:MAG: hypothetical protein ABJB12_10400 [Pseudomonadota bacterium]
MLSERIIRAGHWLRTLWISALICLPQTSRAADVAPALDYNVQETCPGRAAFLDLVRDKLAAAGVDGGIEAPRVTVRIWATDSGFVGRLALQRADAATYDREVTGASCAEVTNALAFVLALALGAKDQASPPVAAPTALEPQPQPKLASPPAAVAMPADASPPPALNPRKSGWRLGAGIQGGERAGLAPRAVPVGAAFVQARRISAPLSGVSFRAGVAMAPRVTVRDEKGRTDFAWWTGTLEVCPIGLRVLGPLEARSCAAMDVGRLQVSGTPPAGPGSKSGSASNVWVDVSAMLRLELPVFGFLSAELQGALVVPVTHYKIAFDPNATVYAVPGLAAAGAIGLAAHFQ